MQLPAGLSRVHSLVPLNVLTEVHQLILSVVTQCHQPFLHILALGKDLGRSHLVSEETCVLIPVEPTLEGRRRGHGTASPLVPSTRPATLKHTILKGIQRRAAVLPGHQQRAPPLSVRSAHPIYHQLLRVILSHVPGVVPTSQGGPMGRGAESPLFLHHLDNRLRTRRSN